MPGRNSQFTAQVLEIFRKEFAGKSKNHQDFYGQISRRMGVDVKRIYHLTHKLQAINKAALSNGHAGSQSVIERGEHLAENIELAKPEQDPVLVVPEGLNDEAKRFVNDLLGKLDDANQRASAFEVVKHENIRLIKRLNQLQKIAVTLIES